MLNVSYSLGFLSLCGLWTPLDRFTKTRRVTHRLFGFLSLLSVCLTFSSELTSMIINFEDYEYFIESSYLSGTTFNSCFKALFLLVRQKKIAIVLESLIGHPFKTGTIQELTLEKKFNRLTKFRFNVYKNLIMMTALGINIRPIFTFASRVLPIPAWIPYDYQSHAAIFVLTWLFQSFSAMVITISQVGVDTLITGLMISVCGQLEILELGIKKLSALNIRNMDEDPREILSNFVNYHNYIFKYAYLVNDVFSPILFMQFATSMMMICSTVCLLSMSDMFTVNFGVNIVFLSACLVQILMYCWHGNEVILKSQSISYTAYKIDWTKLSLTEQKYLPMIMMRVTTPIVFTSSFLVTLSLESFVKILKMSYSVFNLMKQ